MQGIIRPGRHSFSSKFRSSKITLPGCISPIAPSDPFQSVRTSRASLQTNICICPGTNSVCPCLLALSDSRFRDLGRSSAEETQKATAFTARHSIASAIFTPHSSLRELGEPTNSTNSKCLSVSQLPDVKALQPDSNPTRSTSQQRRKTLSVNHSIAGSEPDCPSVCVLTGTRTYLLSRLP